jgi:hypothetical protein
VQIGQGVSDEVTMLLGGAVVTISPVSLDLNISTKCFSHASFVNCGIRYETGFLHRCLNDLSSTILAPIQQLTYCCAPETSSWPAILFGLCLQLWGRFAPTKS